MMRKFLPTSITFIKLVLISKTVEKSVECMTAKLYVYKINIVLSKVNTDIYEDCGFVMNMCLI